MQLALLLGQKVPDRYLQGGAHRGKATDQRDRRVDQVLVECQNHKEFLYVHLYDGLADEGGPEEGPEGDEEVAAGDARQVEQGIGDLRDI